MIPDEKIAEIRERADIVEIVSEYVTLKRAGTNFKGVCPFHADSDPSFNVNPSRHFFHCFGCSASGDVFNFVQRIEGIEFMDAARLLAGKYGVQLPEKPMTPEAKSKQDRAREEKERRRFILETATAFFESKLWSSEGRTAQTVLKERGISEETAKTFRLGYAPDGWQGLLDFLAKSRVSAREVEAVGLALPRKNGSGYYDRFRNRLVFTITDSHGHPIAFSARALPGEDTGAKYINSPETREYTKGKVLFGLHQARVSLSKLREAVLVEGNFDVVAMHEAGFHNVLAPLGTAFTDEQAALLRRRVDRVTIMFDGDRAGMAAAARAFPVLAKVGLAGYMAPLPAGEDPDSLIRDKGPQKMKDVLSRATGLLDQIIRMTADASDGSTQDVARRVTKLRPLINSVKDGMERDMYRQKVAAAFSVSPAIVFRYLRDEAGKRDGLSPAQRTKLTLAGYVDERELIGLLLDVPVLCDEAVTIGAVALIRTPQLKELAEQLVFNSHHHTSAASALVADSDHDAVANWFARRGMERLFENEETGKEALYEIKANMEKRSILNGSEIEEIKKQIQLAHSSGDDMMVLSLQRRKTELERMMHGAAGAFDNDNVRH
ncbi:MAG: DNA primase [Deltaproteobacteria bacterium]|nr:DNA primase [Deltaproteobacteria bacterium]